MGMNRRLWVFLGALALGVRIASADAPGTINIHADRPGAAINPGFYGLMTEEINHAYDGGLYAELIQNRAFQDDGNTPVHWSIVQTAGAAGSIALDTSQPISAALTTCLHLTVTTAGGGVGAANDGYWGIPVMPNTAYRASFYAKASTGFLGPLTVDIESADGSTVYAQAQAPLPDGYWRKYTVALQTGGSTPTTNARFVVSAHSTGSVWVNQVSLFPPTFNARPNGNRIDLMQKLDAMSPAFLRLPGGNYLDPGHYVWKTTIGPLDDRPGHPGAWSYRSSDGLGLLEFMEWCEDLKMLPLLAVSDGRGWLAADADVTPLVQDALDEIEYVTGDVSTPWGAKRAADGHPAPFTLKYIEVGNEDFFDSIDTYNTRFRKFNDAIRARYPQLQIIATRRDVSSRRPDIVDDHIYASPTDMLAAAHNYDNYSRTAPKVFVGEWATTYGNPTPTLLSALTDAAYLTGLERNADVVTMASYAPLLVNVNPGASQWGTNLIGYDALTSFGSPSYWMQTMFNHNRGDVVLPVDVTAQTVPAATAPQGAIGVGTWATQADFRNISVTNGSTVLYQKDFANGASDWAPDNGTWQAANGILSQSATSTDCRITAGSTAWKDYSYTLQARKTGGSEGFLIMFHVRDHNNYLWWNVGGWGNTRTAIQRAILGGNAEISTSSSVTVDTGRWYNVRIDVQGTSIKCYLDGTLVSQATDNSTTTEPVFAAASRDNANGDVILKVVNVSSAPQQLQVNVSGAGGIAATAAGQVLTGQPDDVNSVAAPEKITPQPLLITNAGTSFTQSFPAYSVSVMRLKQTTSPAYTMADAVEAERQGGGLKIASLADVRRLDAVSTGTSANRVELLDAVRVTRIVTGLDLD